MLLLLFLVFAKQRVIPGRLAIKLLGDTTVLFQNLNRSLYVRPARRENAWIIPICAYERKNGIGLFLQRFWPCRIGETRQVAGYLSSVGIGEPPALRCSVQESPNEVRANPQGVFVYKIEIGRAKIYSKISGVNNVQRMTFSTETDNLVNYIAWSYFYCVTEKRLVIKLHRYAFYLLDW